MLAKSKQEQIIKLRQKGYGYQTISTITGIKRDTVRDICKRYGLTGYLAYNKSKIPDKEIKIKEYPKNCLYCDKAINRKVRRGRKAKFCSKKCSRKWWEENK